MFTVSGTESAVLNSVRWILEFFNLGREGGLIIIVSRYRSTDERDSADVVAIAERDC